MRRVKFLNFIHFPWLRTSTLKLFSPVLRNIDTHESCHMMPMTTVRNLLPDIITKLFSSIVTLQ